MNRLSVLVAASRPAVRRAILQTVAARNYTVVEAPIDDALPDTVTTVEHHLAVLAPEDEISQLEFCRAYRERARLEKVGIAVCIPPSAGNKGKALGDHVVVLEEHPDGDWDVDREDLLEAIDQASRHLITILVADDEPLIRRMFEMYFTNEGYKVVTAEDGDEAIRRVRELRPDLVVTDIQMPGCDGYTVCRTIKESKETQHIPVIIVSALGEEAEIARGFSAGANEYVRKPVDLNDLSGRIQSIFRGIATRGRERILVAAASAQQRSALSIGLRKQGFEVSAASTGEQALELAMSDPPSVLVTDLRLPGLGLPALRERLRESSRTHDLPLVVLREPEAKVDRVLNKQLRAADYITKPFPMDRLVVTIERLLGERRSNLELEREILLQTITTLVTTLEARDSYTRGHSENVARYTKAIAKRVISSNDEIARIELSAQLHDLGKIGVPDAILLKPGRLTDEEMRTMQTHPAIGAEMLQPIQSLQDILPGVRWHHERIDGKGYPDGLPGSEIPLMARIIAVADTFDALTSNRPYRQGCPVPKALNIIREVAGTQLDADLVKVFDEIIAERGDKIMVRDSAPVLEPGE